MVKNHSYFRAEGNQSKERKPALVSGARFISGFFLLMFFLLVLIVMTQIVHGRKLSNLGPLRLSVKNDGQFIMYQTIGISLIFRVEGICKRSYWTSLWYGERELAYPLDRRLS